MKIPKEDQLGNKASEKVFLTDQRTESLSAGNALAAMLRPDESLLSQSLEDIALFPDPTKLTEETKPDFKS